MALKLVTSGRGERRDGHPKPFPEACPVCDGEMEVVYARNNQQVCVCVDCHTGVTVPATAWQRMRDKRRPLPPMPQERNL